MEQPDLPGKAGARKKPTESHAQEKNRRARKGREQKRKQEEHVREYQAKIQEIRAGMEQITGSGPFEAVRKVRVAGDGLVKIFAGDDGHIYSSRGLPSGIFRRMTETPSVSGRLSVKFKTGPRESRKPEGFFVDRLVAASFVGPSPGKDHEVLHLDEDLGNNRPENLRWERKEIVLPIANRHLRGEGNANAILTWQKVAEIRRRSAAGERRVRLAEEFGVSAPTISAIVNGRIWKDSFIDASVSSSPPVMGDAHHNAKMTMEKAEEVRRKHKEGKSYAEIAQEYGVSKPLIKKIVLGAAWMPVLLEAKEIRDLWFRTGKTTEEIAREYGVPKATIRKILLPIMRADKERNENPYDKNGRGQATPRGTGLVYILASGDYPAGGQMISPCEVIFRRFDGNESVFRVATGRMEIRNLIGHGLVIVGWRTVDDGDEGNEALSVAWIYATSALTVGRGSSAGESWSGSDFCDAKLDDVFPRTVSDW